jgi:hypothetical protein
MPSPLWIASEAECKDSVSQAATSPEQRLNGAASNGIDCVTYVIGQSIRAKKRVCQEATLTLKSPMTAATCTSVM